MQQRVSEPKLFIGSHIAKQWMLHSGKIIDAPQLCDPPWSQHDSAHAATARLKAARAR